MNLCLDLLLPNTKSVAYRHSLTEHSRQNNVYILYCMCFVLYSFIYVYVNTGES